MGYLINGNKSECNGCMACGQVCPVPCITFESDDKGFWYPLVDEDKCIHCNLCIKVCPEEENSGFVVYDEPKAYGALHKDDEIRMKSSSGGAFAAIVEAFCDENYVIFGVTYDENMKVIHSYITDKKDLSKFQKSKYVESDTKNVFNEVKQFLKEGKKVLFTGTPCQITGLKKLLNKDYDNLLCVEVVCHGVGSPKAFDVQLKEIERRTGNKIVWFDMRDKIKKDEQWNLSNGVATIATGNRVSDKNTNLYVNAFKNNYGFRESCYSCQHGKTEYSADISIGDLWGAEDFLPDWFDGKGISLILVHNDKGQAVVNASEKYMRMTEVSFDDAKKQNPNLYRTTYKKEDDDAFWGNKTDRDILKGIKKYGVVSWKSKLYNEFYYIVTLILPRSFKDYIKNHRGS